MAFVKNDHETKMRVWANIQDVLLKKIQDRPDDPNWIDNEVRAVWAEAQRIAGKYDLHRVSFEAVKVADQSAVGHVDWFDKFTLRVAEKVVYG